MDDGRLTVGSDDCWLVVLGRKKPTKFSGSSLHCTTLYSAQLHLLASSL
jgi:hypothetical protein